jgi:aminopeptidase
MQDPRIDRLAHVLIDHSCRLQAGETVLVEAFDLPDPALVCRLVELAAERGGRPVVSLKNNLVLRSLYQTGTPESIGLIGQLEKERMARMDAYIGIRGAANSREFADVPADKLDLSQEPKTRWVVLRYPTPAMAQSAQMSTSAFEDFYFDVCTADYAEMERRQEPLKKRMLEADQVHILGPGTDLKFSIRGINVVPCNGRRNIPDGEVFTCPVRDSANGVIQYNTPSLYQGTVFEGIRFEFRNGRIVKADCRNESTRLNQILDSDEGARYLGEWSLGCNNRIRRPMLDTLFDEKIGGSMHLTPGNAYETADNGNRSRVHWDLVLMQTPEAGGGEVWFDGELVRKDGWFIPEDLRPLNEGLQSSQQASE